LLLGALRLGGRVLEHEPADVTVLRGMYAHIADAAELVDEDVSAAIALLAADVAVDLFATKHAHIWDVVVTVDIVAVVAAAFHPVHGNHVIVIVVMTVLIDGAGGLCEMRVTHRRILSDILRDASGGADRGAEFVAVDTRSVGLAGPPASAAFKHEGRVLGVFFGVEDIGAVKGQKVSIG